MKEYNKLIRKLDRNIFNIVKTTRKTTIKIVHIKSGEFYSVHPGNNAVKPIERWKNKIIKKYEI